MILLQFLLFGFGMHEIHISAESADFKTLQHDSCAAAKRCQILWEVYEILKKHVPFISSLKKNWAFVLRPPGPRWPTFLKCVHFVPWSTPQFVNLAEDRSHRSDLWLCSSDLEFFEWKMMGRLTLGPMRLLLRVQSWFKSDTTAEHCSRKPQICS